MSSLFDWCPPGPLKKLATVLSGKRVVAMNAHDVVNWMPALLPDAEAEIPEALRGIWYMDGNPEAEELACLNGMRYDSKTRVARGRPWTGPGWTYDPPPPNSRGHRTWRGIQAMFGIATCRPGLIFRFDDALRSAAMTLTFTPVCCPCVLCETAYCCFVPRWFLDLSLDHGIDDHGIDNWHRKTTFCRGTCCEVSESYILRKIVTNGDKVQPNYDEMIREVPELGYTFRKDIAKVQPTSEDDPVDKW